MFVALRSLTGPSFPEGKGALSPPRAEASIGVVGRPTRAAEGRTNNLPHMPSDFRSVDPRELRLPPSRRAGADPVRLARPTAAFGSSTDGMPALWVDEASDGVLVIYNGVTRATRVATAAPGKTVRVEVIGKLRRACAADPTIGDIVLRPPPPNAGCSK